MAKENFKVGEEVKPRYPERWEQRNNIGTVVKVSTKRIIVEWKKWEWNGTVIESIYSQSDIKHAHAPQTPQTPRKDEQLVFDFMIDCCYML